MIYNIYTAPPANRVYLLKSCQELEDMEDDDTNIDKSNLLIRYSKSEKALEKTSLAEWTAWYDCRATREKEPSENRS